MERNSGNTKRWKRSNSPSTILEPSSDSETTASSRTETVCSPSSSSASSSALNQTFSKKDDEHQVSPTSSYDDENDPASPSFQRYAKGGFRRFSKLLDRSNLNCRSLPPQLKTEKWGSPRKFWDVLCNKTKVYRKDSDWSRFHPDLTKEMRFILLEWLMEVSDDLSLERESFYLAIDYIDRFFSVHRNVRKTEFQLIGATALFLAAKNEEVEPPRLCVFVDYGDGAYKEESLRKCELIMLHDLEWQMNPITPLHWLRIYMQLAGCEDQTFNKFRYPKQNTDGMQEVHDSVSATANFPRLEFLHLVKELDLCVLDYDSLSFDPSILSAALFSLVFGPDEVTEEVTGYEVAKLAEARKFVKPYLLVCNKCRPLGDPIKIRNGIRSEEMHNIQTLHPHLNKLMKEAHKLKDELESKRYDNNDCNFSRSLGFETVGK